MPLTRSTEDLTDVGAVNPTNVSFVVDLGDTNPSGSTTGNRTHGMKTRFGGNRNVSQGTRANANGSTADGLDENGIHQLIRDSFSDLRTEIMASVTREMEFMARGWNNSGGSNRGTASADDRPQTLSPNITMERDRRQPVVQDNSERILNIVRNWGLKFSGDPNGMDVDEFIYRVQIMTTNTLSGNFDVLCRYIHILFDGKALSWFWRFHRQNDGLLAWSTLSGSLRKQYGQVSNDSDIRDDIRRRKQKYNENFDEFAEAIVILADRLRTSLSEDELCEEIKRNLRPEIRHELLHLEISSVSDLRKAVRRHEKFVRDNQTRFRYSKEKGQLAEIEEGEGEYNDTKDHNDVCEVGETVICWNCDGTGHVYKDCTDERRIFCYGCGKKNVYRPNCSKCCKQGNFKADAPGWKRGHPMRTQRK